MSGDYSTVLWIPNKTAGEQDITLETKRATATHNSVPCNVPEPKYVNGAYIEEIAEGALYEPPLCECRQDFASPEWLGEKHWNKALTKNLGPNIKKGFCVRKCPQNMYFFHVDLDCRRRQIDCVVSKVMKDGFPYYICNQYCLMCRLIKKRTYTKQLNFSNLTFIEWTICDNCKNKK